MAHKKPDNLLTDILLAQAWLNSIPQMPHLLTADNAPQKLEQVRRAFNELVTYRNIITSLSKLDEPPLVVARQFSDMEGE